MKKIDFGMSCVAFFYPVTILPPVRAWGFLLKLLDILHVTFCVLSVCFGLVRCMMYGFGDDQNPYSESVDMLEDLVIEFITEMVNCY